MASVALLAGLSATAPVQARSVGNVLESGIPFDLPPSDRVSVLDRQHPELDPLGVRAGGFLLFPQVTVTAEGRSNVFAQTSDPKADADGTVDARIDAHSQWGRHQLNAHVEGDLKRYASYPIKKENGYDVGIDGRIDLAGESNIIGWAQATRIYIDQFSGDFTDLIGASVPLDRQTGFVRGTYAFNRLKLVGDANFTRLNFHDTRSLSGITVDQNYLDQDVTRLIGRAEYLVSPATLVFAQGTYIDHDYTNTANRLDRTGHEWRGLAGVTFDLTNLIRTRLGVGYFRHDYDDPTVRTLKGLAVDAQVDFFVTQLMTITFTIEREVRDAVIAGSAGYKTIEAGAGLNYELLRNLIVSADANYQDNDYAQIDRRDRIAQLTAGATYTVNRYLVLNPTVEYADRKSSGANSGQRFDEFRGGIAVTLRR